MDRKGRIDELRKLGKNIIEAKADGDLSDADRATLAEYKTEIDKLTGELAKIAEDATIKAAFSHVSGSDDSDGDEGDNPPPPGDGAGTDGAASKGRTLGEHFVKSVGRDRILGVKGTMGAGVAAPEFKAATDTHTVAEAVTAGVGPWMTQYDRTIVQAYRPQVQVKNLFGQGTLSGDTNTIAYLVEKAREGDPALTAEAGAYAQVHYLSPEPKSESLQKITALAKLTDESIADMAFVTSEIDGRIRYDIDWKTELQLLSGATGLVGVLNRSGVQTEAVDGTEGSGDSVQDALFRALTKVTTATGLKADAIVINPLDYQALRLVKDGNGQYMGGGFFAGQYGQGGIVEDIPIWGTKTVVTPAIAQGTALVGAFAASATVYTKGGIAVSMTNSNEDDFNNGLVSLRADVRHALAVRRPSGFVKVTL